MSYPLTRDDLDGVTCQMPGCDHTTHAPGGLALKGRCHPHADVVAWYGGGVLTIRCGRCALLIAEVAVARGDGKRPLYSDVLMREPRPKGSP